MKQRIKRTTKMFNLRIDPEIIRQLKIACAKTGFSMSSTVEGMIKFYLETYNFCEDLKTKTKNEETK